MNEFHIYLLITIPICLYLTFTSKSQHKTMTLIMILWLMDGTVLLGQDLVYYFAPLSIDIQPDRFMLLFCSLYLLPIFFRNKNRIIENSGNSVSAGNPKFEKYLFIYICSIIIMNIFHSFNILEVKDVILNTTQILTFLVIYLMLKNTADQGMIKAVFKSILIVCAISSVIAMYQFFVNPFWFRIGSERVAFSYLLRPNGIFFSEYDLSYFLVTGVLVALLTVRRSLIRYILIGIFMAGVVLSFHRMSWIVCMLLFALYFVLIKQISMRKVMVMVGITLIIYLSYLYFTSMIYYLLDSPIYQERVAQDTATGRMEIYRWVISKLPDYWLTGYGSSLSSEYYFGMRQLGFSKKWALGNEGGIHNGFLVILFLYGLPAAIFLSYFLFQAYRYFFNLLRSESKFYFVPYFVVLMYVISNLTNAFLFHNEVGLILSIFLGIGTAVANDINMDEDTFVRIWRHIG